MTEPQQGFAIAVDLGTSNTVAVVRWPDGRTRPLLVDGAPIMPSGVYLDDTGRLHVGRDAQRMAGLDPSRFEPNPKRRIDEPAVLLGDREVPTVALLGAILAAVARAAVEAVGFLPPAVLTYPAAWGARRRDTLAAAAGRAGWPPALLVPEPVAAARYFADVLRRPVPVGAALAVFDFGGGTLDIAVVRNDNGRFTVLGSGGIEDLGGLDVDSALVEHLGIVISETAAPVWSALRNPDGTTQRRDRRLFWDDVRGAKEMLSRASVAPITVPGRDQAIHLTREELERVTEPLIRRAVWETGAVIERCGLRPDQLAGLFLVGGSSRLPLAARLLHGQLGIAPTVLEQPELPVAEGALAELMPAAASGSAAFPTSPGFATSPGFGTSAAAMPVSPAFAGQTSTMPVSGVPTSPRAGYPTQVSPPGVLQAAAPAGYGPQSGFPQQPGGPVFPSRGPGGPPGGSVGRPWYLRRPALVSATAAVVVLAIVATAGFVYLRSRNTTVDFATLTSVKSFDIVNADSARSAVSATLGDQAFFGTSDGKSLQLTGLDLSSLKKARWGPVQLSGGYSKWAIHPNPNGLIVTGTGSGSSDPGAAFLLDPNTGKQRSRTAFEDDDRLYYLGDEWAIHSYTGKKLSSFSWTNGATKWERPDNKAGSFFIGETSANDLRGPSTFDGGPTDLDLGYRKKLISVDGDDKIRLLDATKNSEIRSWNNVGGSYDKYMAHDGKLFVYSASTKYRIQEYDLDKTDEPQSIYSAPDDKRTVVDLEPCGSGRVCLLDRASYDGKDTELVAIDIASRKQLWRKPAAGTAQIIPVGDQVLATNSGGTPASVLYSADGTPKLQADDEKADGVRVTSGSLLFFTGTLSPASGYDLGLVGVTASTGARVSLGQLSKTRGSSCSWSSQFILCATVDKLQVWRFTAG